MIKGYTVLEVATEWAGGEEPRTTTLITRGGNKGKRGTRCPLCM